MTLVRFGHVITGLHGGLILVAMLYVSRFRLGMIHTLVIVAAVILVTLFHLHVLVFAVRGARCRRTHFGDGFPGLTLGIEQELTGSHNPLVREETGEYLLPTIVTFSAELDFSWLECTLLTFDKNDISFA